MWFGKASVLDAADKVGLSLSLVTKAAEGNAVALAEVARLTDTSALSYAELAKRSEELGLNSGDYLDYLANVRDGVKGEAESLQEATRAAELKARADEEAGQAASEHEDALRELTGAADTTKQNIDELSDTIRGFGSATLDTRSAARDFEQALDDLQQSITDNGATLDIGTQKGRDNQAAVDDLARATKELAAATVEQTGDQAAANTIIADGRQKLIEMLGQFGITEQAAEDYADELGLIPGNVDTAVALHGVNEAEQRLAELPASPGHHRHAARADARHQQHRAPGTLRNRPTR